MFVFPSQDLNAEGTFDTTNLKAVVNTDRTITLNWDTTKDADGYIIYRRVGDGAFSYLYMSSKEKYTDMSAVVNQLNFYRVYPYKNNDGKRILGKSQNYVYGKPVVGTVKNLSVSQQKTSSKVDLKWEKISNITGYIVYRRIGDGTFQYLTMTSTNAYTDSTAVRNVYNYYRVYPYYKKGDTRYIGTSANYVYIKPTVGAVENLKASANNQRQIKLSWTKNQNADGYIIYRKKTGEKTFSYIGMTSGLSWTNSNLESGVFYYYRVYPYITANDKKELGITTTYVYAKAASKEKLSGLTKVDGKYFYYLSNGQLRKGFGNWNDIGKAYFDENTGEMHLGKTTVASNGYTYYFREGGGVETGFKTVNGKKYYFNPNGGAMLTGYMTIDGKKYYLDPKTGEMKTGMQTVTLSNGTYTFYFEENGGIYKGFKSIDGKVYYFNSQYGEMVTDTMMVIENKKYYFTSDGSACNGIMYSEKAGASYYFDPASETGVRTGLQDFEDATYYFNPEDGRMNTGFWSFEDRIYFFDSTSGKMAKNITFDYRDAGIRFTADANGKLTWETIEGYENNKRTIAILAAFEKLGYPYRTDDTGYVCSSLVSYAYSQAGFYEFEGMESHQQAKYCYENGYSYNAKTTSIDDVIRPGDLVFWSNYACNDANCDHWEEIHHVGIYLGNGQMVEASEKQDTMLVHNIMQNDDFVIRYYASVLEE